MKNDELKNYNYEFCKLQINRLESLQKLTNQKSLKYSSDKGKNV